MTTVAHCPQVVALFDFARIGLTIEPCHDDAITRYGVGDTAGLSHQFLVVIVRADVHPVLVALRRQLILQLDVVEAAIVGVEAVDAYGHVP